MQQAEASAASLADALLDSPSKERGKTAKGRRAKCLAAKKPVATDLAALDSKQRNAVDLPGDADKEGVSSSECSEPSEPSRAASSPVSAPASSTTYASPGEHDHHGSNDALAVPSPTRPHDHTAVKSSVEDDAKEESPWVTVGTARRERRKAHALVRLVKAPRAEGNKPNRPKEVAAHRGGDGPGGGGGVRASPLSHAAHLAEEGQEERPGHHPGSTTNATVCHGPAGAWQARAGGAPASTATSTTLGACLVPAVHSTEPESGAQDLNAFNTEDAEAVLHEVGAAPCLCLLETHAGGTRIPLRPPLGQQCVAVQVLSPSVPAVDSAIALGLRLSHLLGLHLGSLSSAQLDAVQDFHEQQLQRVAQAHLLLHRHAQAEAQAAQEQLEEDVRAAVATAAAVDAAALPATPRPDS